MTIIIKNKDTLIFDDFKFRCSIGKMGFTKNKKKEIKKPPEEYLILEIFTIER